MDIFDISYYKGRFYITATYRLNDTGNVYRKQIVVSSDKPEGPYSKPAIIDEDGIDPSIFNDDDGRRYMLLNRGARIFELNEDATKQISKAELLFYGDNKRAPEGPHLLKKDGYYYLFEAEGGTGPGHRITVSRSRELKGMIAAYTEYRIHKDDMQFNKENITNIFSLSGFTCLQQSVMNFVSLLETSILKDVQMTLK